jgi:hypothetical protein
MSQSFGGMQAMSMAPSQLIASHQMMQQHI